MTDLREKIVEIIRDAGSGDDVFETPHETADRILALPEIANALKLAVVKPLNLGPSVSTGKRTPV